MMFKTGPLWPGFISTQGLHDVDSIWMKIAAAALMGFMIIRMIPVAKQWMENGPKGSSKEWLNVSLLALGVVLFVVFLGSLV